MVALVADFTDYYSTGPVRSKEKTLTIGSTLASLADLHVSIDTSPSLIPLSRQVIHKQVYEIISSDINYQKEQRSYKNYGYMHKASERNKGSTAFVSPPIHRPFFTPFLQPKLTINEPDDIYEREADTIADKVMRMPNQEKAGQSFFRPHVSSLQRKCTYCEEEEEKVQRKEMTNEDIPRNIGFESDVNQLDGSGQSLPDGARRFFEPRFGHGFNRVEMHTGAKGAVVQRMLACPTHLNEQEAVPSGWKPYHGNPCVFHCCYRGILEDRMPSPSDPQNECFYDETGRLVDHAHPYSGCRGTPDYYDSASNPLEHVFLDSGGIVRAGLPAFLESMRHSNRDWGTRRNPFPDGTWYDENGHMHMGPGPKW